MLIQQSVTFAGVSVDEHGLPDPFHTYIIFAGPARYLGAGFSMASILPLTQSPIPVPGHFPVKGTPYAALQKARAALAGIPEFHELRKDEGEIVRAAS